jgi:single-strand DNA-binding protein
MAGLNKVTVIGNLGRDPEVRYTQSGTAVCNLRIGVTERRKEGDNWTDHTEWFSVVCFGKTAENATRFLKKGRQVYVEGRLQTRSWTDKEGQTRYTTEIIANQLLFLGGGKEVGGDASSAYAPSSFGASENNSANSSAEFEPISGYMEDDIPF